MKRAWVILVGTGFAAAGGWWSAFGSRSRPPSTERRAAEREATPDGYVYVPGGACWIGSDDADANDADRPRRRVFVPSFYIGRCEVTQGEWKRFRPDHRVPPEYGRWPVTAVLREDAEAYCRWVGGRLPTDVEWEKAARGTDGRRYPWGDDFDPARCNLVRKRGSLPEGAWSGVRRGLKPVDSYPTGTSPFGALNMAGNAWEWVSGSYDNDPQRGIIRGGAVGYFERDARTYHRAIEGACVT